MKVTSRKIKGTYITVDLQDTNGCCGVYSVQSYYPYRGDGPITQDEADYLHWDLYTKIREISKKVLTATDAVGDDWTGGNAGASGRTELLSLEKFCEYAGFEEVYNGINPNNGHTLKTYIDGWFIDRDRQEHRDMPERPDIVIEQSTPANSTTVEGMVDLILEALDS